MLKKTLFFLALIVSHQCQAQNINKNIEQIKESLNEYSLKLDKEKNGSVIHALQNLKFSKGDEWGFDPEMPRYSVIIDGDIIFKIDVNKQTNEVYTVWLLYPRAREYALDVETMKLAVPYVVNKNIIINTKHLKKYIKIMDSPRDEKGKSGNFGRIDGYVFMNALCSDTQSCITAEND